MTPLQKLIGDVKMPPDLPIEGEEPVVRQTPTKSRPVKFGNRDVGVEPRISAKQFAVLRLRQEHQGGFLAYVRSEKIELIRQTAAQWDAELAAYKHREVR